VHVAAADRRFVPRRRTTLRVERRAVVGPAFQPSMLESLLLGARARFDRFTRSARPPTSSRRSGGTGTTRASTWYPGGHILQFRRGVAMAAVRTLIADAGLLPGAAAAAADVADAGSLAS